MMHYPNMIIIAGSGKNVGKTLLSCRIIEHLSVQHNVTAFKTSPHMHALSNADNLIAHTEQYVIIDEQRITKKDSSRMLQAGAKKSYFFQYREKGNSELFEPILPFLPKENPIVCESAGILSSVKPEVFIYIAGSGSPKQTIINETARHCFTIEPHEVETFDVKMFSFESGKINVSFL